MVRYLNNTHAQFHYDIHLAYLIPRFDCWLFRVLDGKFNLSFTQLLLF